MSVTIEEVRYTASLAKLKFTEAELEKLAVELNRILEYMEKMNEIDTTDVEPLSHPVDSGAKLREDIKIQGLTREEALKNAPDADDKFFKVPKVIGNS